MREALTDNPQPHSESGQCKNREVDKTKVEVTDTFGGTGASKPASKCRLGQLLAGLHRGDEKWNKAILNHVTGPTCRRVMPRALIAPATAANSSLTVGINAGRPSPE